jgi:hypothetical protein
MVKPRRSSSKQSYSNFPIFQFLRFSQSIQPIRYLSRAIARPLFQKPHIETVVCSNPLEIEYAERSELVRPPKAGKPQAHLTGTNQQFNGNKLFN